MFHLSSWNHDCLGMNEAKAQGYAVAVEDLADMTKWTKDRLLKDWQAATRGRAGHVEFVRPDAFCDGSGGSDAGFRHR